MSNESKTALQELEEWVRKRNIENPVFYAVDLIDKIQSLKERDKDKLTIEDYEEVLESHRELVRNIDEILNGKEGMSKQASLCDLVGQIKELKERESIPSYNEINEEAEKYAELMERGGGFPHLDFYNGAVWLKQQLEKTKEQSMKEREDMTPTEFYKKLLAYKDDLNLDEASPLTHKGVIHFLTEYKNQIKPSPPSNDN